MKDPSDWTESDLLELVATKTPEGINLDYKAGDALENTDGKKNEISKDASAFANSGGGTIIYGMKERDHIGELDAGFDPKGPVTREWVGQVINSRIHQTIDGVRVNVVRLDSTNPGRVAYVVSIPESPRAPHQAHDKKFYKRTEFESVPMWEYEIRDLSRRGLAPDVRVRIAFPGTDPTCHSLEATDNRTVQFGLGFFATNRGREVAEYGVVNILVDRALHALPEQRVTDGHIVSDVRLSMWKVPRSWSVHNLESTNGMPLFGDLEVPIKRMTLLMSREQSALGTRIVVGTHTFAPHMDPRLEFAVLRTRSTQIELEARELSLDGLKAKYAGLAKNLIEPYTPPE